MIEQQGIDLPPEVDVGYEALDAYTERLVKEALGASALAVSPFFR